MSQGGYEAISRQIFQRATRYNIVLLEYDDWRSGSFEPLADIPRDKTVVLGLVSTKTNMLEPEESYVRFDPGWRETSDVALQAFEIVKAVRITP